VSDTRQSNEFAAKKVMADIVRKTTLARLFMAKSPQTLILCHHFTPGVYQSLPVRRFNKHSKNPYIKHLKKCKIAKTSYPLSTNRALI